MAEFTPDHYPPGSKENPLKVWQFGYRCLHARQDPEPEQGQYFVTVGFADTLDLCDRCKAKRAKKERRPSQTPVPAEKWAVLDDHEEGR